MKEKITLNETVCEAIGIALVQLMKQKPFVKITISEIAATAGVSRNSVYRNYENKEQILEKYIQALYQNAIESGMLKQYSEGQTVEQFLLPRFQFIKQNRDFFTVLKQNNLLYYIFEQMNPELLLMLGGHKKGDSSYYFQMFAGAYAGVINLWIRNDFKESEEEMVQIFARNTYKK